MCPGHTLVPLMGFFLRFPTKLQITFLGVPQIIEQEQFVLLK